MIIVNLVHNKYDGFTDNINSSRTENKLSKVYSQGISLSTNHSFMIWTFCYLTGLDLDIVHLFDIFVPLAAWVGGEAQQDGHSTKIKQQKLRS